jgi:outer membrane protein TolC
VALLASGLGPARGARAAPASRAGTDASPAAAPLERLTLADALARAKAQNPTVTVARLEIERAEGLLREARAAEIPSLVGTALYTRLDHDRVLVNSMPGAEPRVTRIGAANQWNTTLTLTVPVLVPTTWSGVSRARDARNQAVAGVADVSRDLAATVARAYLGVVLAKRQVVVAERARDTARAHYDFAHTRLAGGVGNSLDDVRAEQELRTDEAQVANADTGLARARAALAAALSSDHPLDVVDEVELPPLPPAEKAAEEAQRERADVKALQVRVTGARHSRENLWTLYSPYLIANGQAFAQDIGSALQPTRGWQAQLLLTLPFYDGGVRTGERRVRDAQEAEARALLDAALRDVATEVRTAFEVVQQQDRSLTAAREGARLARRAAELADLAYRAGATTNLEVIDAERRARDAETQAALAEDASRQARLDLLLATGRFP